MKKLIAFRHSIKDGPNNTLGPKGIALAEAQGNACILDALSFHTVGHGILTRTAQTALAFLQAGYDVPRVISAIVELGSDDWFNQMTMNSSAEFVDFAKMHGNFAAVCKIHPEETVKQWAEIAYRGLQSFIDQMPENDDRHGLLITHSPTLELAIWHALGHHLPSQLQIMKEMEGVELAYTDGKLEYVRKIGQPTMPTV